MTRSGLCVRVAFAPAADVGSSSLATRGLCGTDFSVHVGQVENLPNHAKRAVRQVFNLTYLRFPVFNLTYLGFPVYHSRESVICYSCVVSLLSAVRMTLESLARQERPTSV